MHCAQTIILTVIAIPALIIVPLHAKSRRKFLDALLIPDFLAWQKNKTKSYPSASLERLGQSPPARRGYMVGMGMYDD